MPAYIKGLVALFMFMLSVETSSAEGDISVLLNLLGVELRSSQAHENVSERGGIETIKGREVILSLDVPIWTGGMPLPYLSLRGFAVKNTVSLGVNTKTARAYGVGLGFGNFDQSGPFHFRREVFFDTSFNGRLTKLGVQGGLRVPLKIILVTPQVNCAWESREGARDIVYGASLRVKLII